MRDDDEIVAIAVPILCELVAVILLIACIAVWAAIRAGA